jgi:thioesterase domain-containing protein/acyl carrier protein
VSSVPIGKPISDVQILILNLSGGLAGPGEIGEIYVRTPYLSVGYANDDDLTGERFVPNPFTNQTQDRMYRTGDLGRYRPDGVIEFAGRRDHRIKIRGYRVELGEIEAALAACQNVRQCAVALRRGTAPDLDALIAYVVPAGEKQPAASEILPHLRSFLPEYMIPAAVVYLEKIPLTPNGKIDRKSLPVSTDDLSPRTENAPTLPRNKVESTMVDIWSEVLARKPIGIFEHFFELGGHSLSATKLISRLNSALGIQIPLKSLFTDPTIAALAALIRYDEVDDVYYYIGEPSRWKLLVPAQPKGSQTPFFFVGGYMDPNDTLRILSNLIPHLGFDQPVYGLQPRWLDGQSPRYSSVEEVVVEFVTELRAFRPHGPYLLGGDCVGGIIALEMARMLISQGEKVALLAMFDSERPTLVRDFAADLRIAYRRSKRICQKIGLLLTWGNPLKKQLVHDIFRRKGIPLQSQNRAETFDERIYRLRVDYRRMIYCYRVRKYPGKITMIVNETQYRVDKTMGWTGIPAAFEVHVTPGDHWTRYVKYGREIAAVVTECIARAKSE